MQNWKRYRKIVQVEDQTIKPNSRMVEETQITIANIKEKAHMDYRNNNFEEVIVQSQYKLALKQPII